jgi:hypothetical protein
MSSVSIKHIKNFIGFAAKELGLTSIPKINFTGSSENKKNAFGHFISDRKGTSISVRITNRHPIDVMRTIAHELIHYKQKMSGGVLIGHNKEDDANAMAGRIMKKFDTTYPNVFKDMPISEEEGSVMGTQSLPHVNKSSGPGIARYDPLIQFKGQGMLKRKQPKGLRDIIKKEVGLEKRQERRVD